MFVECTHVKTIWRLLEKHIHGPINVNITLGVLDILFGYHLNNQNKIPGDTIILITKKYIFDLKFKNDTSFYFNFDTLKYNLNQTFKDEQYVATINTQRKFNIVWNNWRSVFCN